MKSQPRKTRFLPKRKRKEGSFYGAVDENRITVVRVSVRDVPYYQFRLGTGAAASVNRKTVMAFSTSAFRQELLELEHG